MLWRQRCCLLSRWFVIAWSVSTAIRLILWRWRRLLPAVLRWRRLLIRSTLDLMMRRRRWSVMILVLLTRMRLLLRRWLLLLLH